MVLGLVVLAAITEVGLRIYGLGNPVLYEVNALYGYRPKPNQTVRRLRGSVVHINNVGLRANADWDSASANKVLFLGNSVTYGGSYVSNDELFAERTLRSNSRWVAGDGGVNGWGVENIHGLIVGAGFHPAHVYVTVLIENDFYRGLVSKPPFFPESKPVLAIQEGVPHVVFRLRAALHRGDTTDSPGADANVRRAVARLAELDAFVRARGAVHLIYLSPYLSNLNDGVAPDARIAARLAESGIAVTRLADKPQLKALSADARARLYHDGVHLSAAGHALWAEMIRGDLGAAVQR